MATIKTEDTIWKDNGQIKETAPGWATYRQQLNEEFPSPFRGPNDALVENMSKAIALIDGLRPVEGGPAYLGRSEERRVGKEC